MEEEPEEFIHLASDTVDKQASEILKTSTAGVIEMLSDHIDGCTTYIS